jgi:hypothetical protein
MESSIIEIKRETMSVFIDISKIIALETPQTPQGRIMRQQMGSCSVLLEGGKSYQISTEEAAKVQVAWTKWTERRDNPKMEIWNNNSNASVNG